MPYRRRRAFRPRRGGRRYRAKPWYSKKYSVADMARTAWKGVKYIKGLVNAEVHKFGTETSQSPLNTGAITHLSAVAQDDTIAGRTGNSIFARWLSIRGNLVGDFTGQNSQNVRIMLVIDTQQIGDTTPAYLDVMDSNDINGHLNTTTVGRFTVLYDRVFNVSVGAIVRREFLVRKAFKHHIRYNGIAGTDIQRGGIYLLSVSDQNTANPPAFTFRSRLSFYDN